MSQDNEKKGVGVLEVGAGIAAGAGTAHVAGKKMFHDTADRLIKQAEEVTEGALKTFKNANPGPSKSLPVHELNEAIETWRKGATAATEKAIAPLERQAVKLGSPLTRPMVVFKNASLKGKAAMVAAVAGAAIATGYVINKFRNRGASSETETSTPQDATVSAPQSYENSGIHYRDDHTARLLAEHEQQQNHAITR